MEDKMVELVFRPMMFLDIDGVLAIEQQSFSEPWSKEGFVSELENELTHYLLALHGKTIVAYAGVWIIVDEAHITNVAVLPEYRKQAVGERLMREMIGFAAKRGASSMTLEVRPSNAPALHLYEKLGFAKAGVRKNYYKMPQEDAVIMWLKEMI